MTKKRIIKSFTSLLLCCVILFSTINVQAATIGEELFGISFYYFHYLDENGREREESMYDLGSADGAETGITIEKTDLDNIKVSIKGTSNEIYQKTKPVLMWIHKADGLLDATKWTDKEQWYINKLNETFLIYEIPDYTQDIEIEIRVPMKLNLGLTGLINGGYYEIEFYSEDTIPDALKFAYEAQTYTIDELEEYIEYEMSESIDDYYDIDTGFDSTIDGLPFYNTHYDKDGGFCAGISTLTSLKFNGYNIAKEYSIIGQDEEYMATEDYTWYNAIYTNENIHNINLNDDRLFETASPSYSIIDTETSNAWPGITLRKTDDNDLAFYKLLEYYHLKNNISANILGNAKWQNLYNNWSIIDYIASYLRQGKVITANMSTSEGGHAVVGYRLEKVDNKEDTYRLYVYDSNYPDDMDRRWEDGYTDNYETNENGSYKHVFFKKNNEIYIEFTKSSITKYSNGNLVEVDVFDFDSKNTSFDASSKSGDRITFTICKNDDVGVFNYGNESNEIINYKAYPIINDDNTVTIRTFAYYKSGEVEEITNSKNTNVKMDYSFIGWYKVKNSTITLTKNNYVFDDKGSDFIDCYVTYDNHNGEYGEIKVRIPVSN